VHERHGRLGCARRGRDLAVASPPGSVILDAETGALRRALPHERFVTDGMVYAMATDGAVRAYRLG
jgi:hypothetical protein